jgi:hypothetical protein
MTYEIMNDVKTIISTFEDDMFRFSIFDSKQHEYTAKNMVHISDLHQFMVEHKVNKNDRRFIVFNPYANGRKTKINALLPNKIMVDVDVKTPFQQSLLMKDLGVDNISDALSKLLKLFQDDPCCLYVDMSSSGMGIKAVYTIISDAYIKQYPDFMSVTQAQTHYAAKGINYDQNDSLMVLHMFMDTNYKVMLTYLKNKFNLNAVDKGYIDPAGAKLTQGTYSSWGKEILIKTEPHIIYYKLSESRMIKFAKSYQPINKLPDTELTKSNNDYLDKLKIYMNGLLTSGNNDDLLLYNIHAAKLSDLMEHYNYPILLSINWVTPVNQLFFYNILKGFYLGNSIMLNTFNDFQLFISKLNGDGIELKNLIPIYLFDKKDKNKNLFENTYDEIIYYKNYISEKTTEIENILQQHDRVVLEADAGAGKTNFYMDYAINKYLKGEIRKVVIVIPKNSLLDQQYEIISTKYNNVNIIKNYKSAKIENDETGLFLSSTPAVAKIKNIDLLIVDEVQNLVNYSEKIKSNMPIVKKTILVSATPEKYLIYEEDYFYLKLIKEKKDRQILTIKHYSDRNTIFQSLIDPNRKQFIYYLNIDESKKLFTPENFSGITFIFANSKDQDEPAVKNIVQNQFLGGNHVVTTSYLTDGINFNNMSWDDIIIFEDALLTPEEKYQISQRFRHLIGKVNIILLALPRFINKDYKLKYDWTKNMNHFNTKLLKGINAQKILNTERYVKNVMSVKCKRENKNINNIIPKSDILISYLKTIKETEQWSDVFSERENTHTANLFDMSDSDGIVENVKKYIPLTKTKHQILDEKTNTYSLNIDNIKKEAYDDYFLTHYKNNKKVFYNTLDYYFKVNVVWSTDKEDTNIVKDTTFADVFNLYATELSKAWVQLNNDGFISNVENIPNITPEHLTLIKLNKGYFNTLSGKGNVILQLDGDVLKTTLQSNLYEKYINGLKDKKLGLELNVDNLLINGDKINWEKQEKVTDVVKKSNILKNKQTKDSFLLYFSVKDLLKYLSANKNIYDSLLDVNGDPLFSLDEKSCKEYIMKINRHFKIKSILIDTIDIPNPKINEPYKGKGKRKPTIKKNIYLRCFVLK